MKRIGFLWLILIALLALGCTSTPKVAKENNDHPLNGAPQWVFNPEMDGMVSEIGSAPKSVGGFQFQRTEALGNARDALARKLQVKVKNSLKNFSQQTGVGDNQTMDKVVASTSNQLAMMELSGVTQRDMWIDKEGAMYILVVLDSQKVAAAVKQGATTSLKNDQALWQMFLAKKAQDELDSEIEKEFLGK